MKPFKVTTQNPELADRFYRVLWETVEAMEESGVQYAFIGGIASGAQGRPRSTQDIDVFVKPEEAELTIRALAKKGFRVERTDPVWLFKAFKENILVDIIFKSKGEIYLDSEMVQRMVVADFHGRKLRFVSPEDLVIIKALAHSEATPGHWHDALALLSHADIDWDYLVRRARKAPRRILSLLIYAQSADIWVPKQALDQLYTNIFGDSPPMRPYPVPPHAAAPPPHVVSRPHLQMVSHSYPVGVGRLRAALAEDPRTNELDIQIEQSGKKLLIRGEVQTVARKNAVSEIAKEKFPDFEIENQLEVSTFTSPSETEAIK